MPHPDITDEGELSPTSPLEETDTEIIPDPDVGPAEVPGVAGNPVRWYDADRTEPYTRIEPFATQVDTSVDFVFKPVTLTTLTIAMAALAYVAITNDVVEEGRDKKRIGVYAAVASFLLFSMVQFRDGPFIRPHPAFWRIVLGINLIYEMLLVFLLFQDLGSARGMMTVIDPNLGIPLQERSYADNCEFSPKVIWDAIDIFCLAHALGWFGKALILRDYWFCWILSIAFELAEYSLQHQLANFAECWWDHWILDVLVCNWLGTYIGMKTCAYLNVKGYTWRGLRQTREARGLRSRTKRVFKQFSPSDFTTFKWEGTASLTHYVAVVLLLAMFLAAELTPFYLKTLLWLEPEHPLVITRLAGIFIFALPAVRELYQYINDPRMAIRMGQHAWLLFATILTEVLLVFKWGRGVFNEPFPTHVKWSLAIGGVTILVYPTIKFGPKIARRYLRRHVKDRRAKE
ncbi:phosphatidyl serine synthase-domain-containing protein [Hysterangium stoloniferum]|nr:phosphatidyl serine synthase-domain-containing protein [Hysterangium stoloniferum]